MASMMRVKHFMNSTWTRMIFCQQSICTLMTTWQNFSQSQSPYYMYHCICTDYFLMTTKSVFVFAGHLLGNWRYWHRKTWPSLDLPSLSFTQWLILFHDDTWSVAYHIPRPLSWAFLSCIASCCRNLVEAVMSLNPLGSSIVAIPNDINSSLMQYPLLGP